MVYYIDSGLIVFYVLTIDFQFSDSYTPSSIIPQHLLSCRTSLFGGFLLLVKLEFASGEKGFIVEIISLQHV